MSQNKILLVDDDASLLRLLSMRLKAAGFEVATATSGRQALARLPTFQPRVIITDLRMEGMDGLALFNEVHRRYPSLPVIILTAHGTIPDAVNAPARACSATSPSPSTVSSCWTTSPAPCSTPGHRRTAAATTRTRPGGARSSPPARAWTNC